MGCCSSNDGNDATSDLYLNVEDSASHAHDLKVKITDIANKLRDKQIDFPYGDANTFQQRTWTKALSAYDSVWVATYLSLIRSRQKNTAYGMVYANTETSDANIDAYENAQLSVEDLWTQQDFLKKFDHIYMCRGERKNSPKVSCVTPVVTVTHTPIKNNNHNYKDSATGIVGHDNNVEETEDDDIKINSKVDYSGEYVCVSFARMHRKSKYEIYAHWQDLRNGGYDGNGDKYRSILMFNSFDCYTMLTFNQATAIGVELDYLREWKMDDKELKTVTPLKTVKKQKLMNENQSEQRKSAIGLSRVATNTNISTTDGIEVVETRNNDDVSQSQAIGMEASYDDDPWPGMRHRKCRYGNVYIISNVDDCAYYGRQTEAFWKNCRIDRKDFPEASRVAAEKKKLTDPNLPHMQKHDNKLFGCISWSESFLKKTHRKHYDSNNYGYSLTIAEDLPKHEGFGHEEQGLVIDTKDKDGSLRLLRLIDAYDGPLHMVHSSQSFSGVNRTCPFFKEKQNNQNDKRKREKYDVYKEKDIYDYWFGCCEFILNNNEAALLSQDFPQPIPVDAEQATTLWKQQKNISSELVKNKKKFEQSFTIREDEHQGMWTHCMDPLPAFSNI